MQKIFKPRVLTVCLITLLLAACASDPGTSSTSSTHRPISTRTDNSYNQANTSSRDIWQRIRNGYQMPDLINSEVNAKEGYYSQRADYVGRMANRSGDFLYIIMNEVERRRMPSEIALLPFVESAFVTTAQSPVKAAGLWQFMPATGRDFALQQNHFADQRNDVVASTDAALTFLQRLHDQFGDWQLALAAYNWGPGNVSKAVRRAQANGLEGTYSDIKMPLETRQYVPKLQAIKNIVRNPEQFGISLPNIANNLRHEVVSVTRDMDIDTAARLSGLDTQSFKAINPAYKKSIIVASLGSKILVPAERADDVRRALRDNSQKLSNMTTYSTYNTESLDDIASKFNTNADNLRYLNNIPATHFYVKAGSAVLVPRTSNKSSQDIPFEALTAGLATTSGGIGLSNGDYIEQPTIVVNNTDETTRQERSGAAPLPTYNGPGLVAVNNNDNDDLGLLIKNSRSADPATGPNALVVGASMPVQSTYTAPVFVPPVLNKPTPNPAFSNLVVTNPTPQLAPAPTPLVVTNPAPAPLVVTNPAPAPLVVINPVAPSTPVAPTPVVEQVAQAAPEVDSALTPFVSTVVDTPEVIQPLKAKAPVKINKPIVVKAKETKPLPTTISDTKAKVVKVSTNSPAKAQLIPTAKVLPSKAKDVKAEQSPNKNAKLATPAPVKMATKPTDKKPIKTPTTKPEPILNSKKTAKIAPEPVSKTPAKAEPKTAASKAADKTVQKAKVPPTPTTPSKASKVTVASADPKTKKIIKK